MKKETYDVAIRCMEEGISYIDVTGTDVCGNEINFNNEECILAKAANKVGLSGFAFGVNKMAFVCTRPEEDDITELLNIFSFIRNGGETQRNITFEEFVNRSKVVDFDLRLPDIYFDHDGEEHEVVYEESDYTDKVDVYTSLANENYDVKDEDDEDDDDEEDDDEDDEYADFDDEDDEDFIDYIFIAQIEDCGDGKKEVTIGCNEEEWSEGLCFYGCEEEVERYISILGVSEYELINDGYSLVVKVDNVTEDAIDDFCDGLFCSVYDGEGNYEVAIRYR